MRLKIAPHPDTPSAGGTKLEGEVLRPEPARLVLRYTLTGPTGHVAFAPRAASVRRDELWKHTCFEAFLRAPDGSYREFNFSPSTEWAAYSFSAYREGMAEAPLDPPQIETKSAPGLYELQAAFTAPFLTTETNWRLALAAVIEQTGGAKSYWSLHHPPGKPDFHHSDSFAYEFSGAE